MADYINLNELSITTQALLKKINEQSDLKVDKDEVIANTDFGSVIASIGDVDIYNGLDIEQLQYELGLASVAYSGSYNDLEDKPSFYPYVLYASPCNTSYSTAQKSVTVANFSPSQTCLLVVPFTTGSTVDTPTLKINNSTTGSIYLGHDGAVNGTTNVLKWSANTTLVFLYYSNSTTFYFITAISRGGVDPARGANTWFGSSGSAADAIQKVASCDNFVLTRGSLVSVRFSNANTYAGQLSLSVNNTGSKVIHKGSITSTSNPLLWEANTTLTFMYTGNVYQYICSNVDIPNKVSDLTNDSGYQTQSEVNTLIGTAIGNINQFNVAIVQTLPTTDIDAHTIYFLPNSGAGTNVYDEYMYINNNWECIGSTSIDLSNYVQKFLVTLTYDDQNDTYSSDKTYAQISTALANGYDVLLYDGNRYYPYQSTNSTYADRYNAHNFYNIENNFNGSSISQYGYWVGNGYIGDIQLTYSPDIPTATSDLTNDSGFITSADIPEEVFVIDTTQTGEGFVSDKTWGEILQAWQNNKVIGLNADGLPRQFLGLTDGEVYFGDLTPKTGQIYFEGFLATFSDNTQMTDYPVFHYTTRTYTIPTVPTNVSSFTNDSGYLTLATLPIYDGTVI